MSFVQYRSKMNPLEFLSTPTSFSSGFSGINIAFTTITWVMNLIFYVALFYLIVVPVVTFLALIFFSLI